jgi:hypothetical protein
MRSEKHGMKSLSYNILAGQRFLSFEIYTRTILFLKWILLPTSQRPARCLQGSDVKINPDPKCRIRDNPKSFRGKPTIESKNPAIRNTACNHYLIIYWFVRMYFLKSSVVWMIINMPITSSNSWYNICCGKTTYFEHQVRVERACCPVRG